MTAVGEVARFSRRVDESRHQCVHLAEMLVVGAVEAQQRQTDRMPDEDREPTEVVKLSSLDVAAHELQLFGDVVAGGAADERDVRMRGLTSTPGGHLDNLGAGHAEL